MRQIIAALLGPLLISCGSPGIEPKGQPVRIAIGGQATTGYLPATLAQQLGYYEQEGINASLIDFSGGSKALESLMGGSADVVCGYFDHVIQMRAQNQALQAFVVLQQSPGLALVVSPGTKRKIERVSDLPGAVVGVSAVGSSTNFFLRHILSKNGISWKDVSETGIGMSAAAIAAMEHGKVDAAVMGDPAITMLARRKGTLRILADTRTVEGVRQVFGTDAYPAAVFYAREEWIARNHHLAKGLARSMRRTLVWMREHDANSIALSMPVNFRGEDLELYKETIRLAMPRYSLDGKMPPNGPQIVKDVLGLSLDTVRAAEFDLRQTYTNELE